MPPAIPIIMQHQIKNVEMSWYSCSYANYGRCLLQPEPTNLHEAAKQGNVEKCQELLKGGADANAKDARGITPLGVAVGFNRVDVITELLQAGADVALTDSRGNIPLHYAAGDACPPLSDVSPTMPPAFLSYGHGAAGMSCSSQFDLFVSLMLEYILCHTRSDD